MIARTELGSRHFRTRLKPVSGWPPLMALIDLMFLLLLFFVLATSFVRVSGIPVDLPSVRCENTIDIERHVVTLVPGDRANPDKGVLIYFKDAPVSFEQLKQELNAVHNHSGNTSIIIMADKAVPHGDVVKVMAIAEGEKLSTLLSVAPPAEKGQSVFLQ